MQNNNVNKTIVQFQLSDMQLQKETARKKKFPSPIHTKSKYHYQNTNREKIKIKTADSVTVGRNLTGCKSNQNK
jgi:hypothetical protein